MPLRACGAEGFRITAVGPGTRACAARAGRLARPERLNFNTSDDLAAGEIAAQRHANAAVTSRKTPQPKWPTTPQPDMFARR